MERKVCFYEDCVCAHRVLELETEQKHLRDKDLPKIRDNLVTLERGCNKKIDDIKETRVSMKLFYTLIGILVIVFGGIFAMQLKINGGIYDNHTEIEVVKTNVDHLLISHGCKAIKDGKH